MRSVFSPTPIRVSATGRGLHFSLLTPTGNLVVTTVFGVLDDGGRYMAVVKQIETYVP